MYRGAHAGTVLLLVAAILAAGCASGPSLARAVTITPGTTTRVQLLQVQGKTTFLLQNASSTDRAAFYGDGDTPPLAKIVADDQLQALLDVFSEKGMFASSAGSVPPDARDVLLVEQGNDRWIWVRRQPGMQASETVFHEAKAYFLEVYNSSTAYRGHTDGERPDLSAEQDRVRREAAAAKAKLDRLGGRQP